MTIRDASLLTHVENTKISFTMALAIIEDILDDHSDADVDRESINAVVALLFKGQASLQAILKHKNISSRLPKLRLVSNNRKSVK